MTTRFASVATCLLCLLCSSGTVRADDSAPDDPASNSQFAWKMFVQAMQTTSSGGLVFESWQEQCQINPAMPGCPTNLPAAADGKRARTLHASPLARRLAAQNPKLKALVTVNGIECNAMNTFGLPVTNYPAPPLYPPPANVTATAQFCEEVYANPPEVTFITQNNLQTLTGQATYGQSHGNAITLPASSIEVKADWVPTSSFANPTFQCPDPTGSLYTETINGTCYALVGLHLSSKARPDWVWATFEPASAVTNPNRCDPKLYSMCFDPWGTTSTTPYGKDKAAGVKPSAALLAVMKSANLNKAFANYYLTGVQTQFVGAQGKPVMLGSSFVEYNAGVSQLQASCITCHKYAYYDGKPPPAGVPEDNFGGAPSGWANVGWACNANPQTQNCTPVTAPPPTATSQDFSWLLGLMPAGSSNAPAPH